MGETETFRRCVDNTDLPASLEVGRLYHQLAETDEGLIVVDESGEDYVFERERFGEEVYEVGTSWMHAEMDRLRQENEKLRALYFDALQLLAMAGVPKNGSSEVWESDLDRLQASVSEAEGVVQAPGRSEAWFGGSDPDDEPRRGE